MESQPATPPTTRLIITISIGVMIGLLLSAVILIVSGRPRGTAVVLLPSATPGNILVDVSGAVNAPGLYEVSPGSRVADAVKAAGGLSSDAQMTNLNLASPLQDGQKVYVPSTSDPITFDPLDNENQIININAASLAELATLPGIGEGRAADIITYRQNNGAFDTIDEIMNVPGIGQGIFDQIKDRITVAP